MSIQPSPLASLDAAGINRGGRWLVRGVDMTVESGEIVSLIGPNGSGKSTTAKMILGIFPPDEGTASRHSHLSVGYVPQKVSFDWSLPLTVDRFMKLTGRVSSTDIDWALSETVTSHLKREEMRTLSGGEFQRVMLARSIVRKPNLLVLDEPIQGIDFTGEIAIYELIKHIRDELHCGVILISHDLHVVMAATDQVICLNGHVCCSGTPDHVASTAAYRELFHTSEDQTHALYKHRHDHRHLPDGSVTEYHDHEARDHSDSVSHPDSPD